MGGKKAVQLSCIQTKMEASQRERWKQEDGTDKEEGEGDEGRETERKWGARHKH